MKKNILMYCKQLIKSVTLFFFMFLYLNTGSCQTADKNLQKYWFYRERLKDYVVVGTEQGCSLPANSRTIAADYRYDPSAPWNTKYLKWGDATITLAFYLEMLATEYRLLKNNNQPIETTVHELFCALEAINRLDLAAEPAISNGNMAPVLNGFYLRDDVDSNFVTRNWGILNSHRCQARNNVYYVSSDFWYGEYGIDHASSREKIPQSMDQTNHLLVGLALVANLVDNGTLDGTNVFSDGQASVKQEARDIANRLIQYLKNNDWVYRDPYYTDYCTFAITPNQANNDSAYGRVGLEDCKDFLPGLNTGMNAIPLSYGFASAGHKITSANYFDSTTDKYHKLWELFHKDELCYATFTAAESEKWLKLAAINDDWHPTVTPCSWAVFFGGPVAVFNLCDALAYELTSGTVINDACVIISPVNNTGTELSTMCQLFNYEYLPLVHQVLYGGLNPAISNSFYTNILNVAPCKGPYNYGLAQNGTPDRTTYEWSSSSRLNHPEKRGEFCKGDDSSHPNHGSLSYPGDFNGLDYMVYFNLYCLVNDTYVNNYRKTNMDVSTLPNFPITMPIIGSYGNASNPAEILSFNTIEASNTILATGVASYKAADRVFLKPGFKTMPGARFRAYVEPINCTDNATPMYNRTANTSIEEYDSTAIVDNVLNNNVIIKATVDTTSKINKEEKKLVKKISTTTLITIYPNPNNGEFVLELSNVQNGNYNLQITDAVGRSVLEEKINVDEQNLKQNINLQSQGKGIYFVKINGATLNEVRKVVVE